MNLAMKVLDARLQTLLILLPRHSVHSWSSLPLQGVKAVPKQPFGHVMQQGSEPQPLILLRGFPHTFEPA
jgi:hypothetical protein